MAIDDRSWVLACNRFGYGVRPGEDRPENDVRAALLAEISDPLATRMDADLPSTADLLKTVFAYNEERRLEREQAAIAQLATSAMPAPNVAELLFPPKPAPDPAMPMAKPEPPPQQKAFQADALARVHRATSARMGFAERLVAFWSNHFCVSAAKSEIGRAAAGAFEREAIRPHVLGRFSDMLLAVERHPVMLNFLDNAQSIGPNSVAGHNSKAGLNENLAREIMELHTMGVGSGYTQQDVTQLAYILTGWTLAGRDGKLGDPGTFVFHANAHEPLAAVVRDRLYMQEGVEQGVAALRDLAAEPATARHIAFKFARHFVADAPDPALVQRLAKVFADTDGDLGLLARALVTDDAAWRAPATKIRNPWEVTIAAHRAFRRDLKDPGQPLNALNLLGMPLWQPAGPNGFPDDVAAWTSPEGVKTRVELAVQFARQAKDAPKPLDLMQSVLGPQTSEATREALSRAESEEQAYALLLLSPEFQRR